MKYKKAIEKVISYIGKHLDEEIKLEHLCKIAFFSKYHFHRLFTAYTGLSLQQYVRWLRLKRAAHQLIVDKDNKIIDIALNAGFESHEAFTRAFKQICGVSPNMFRKNISWSSWEKPPYSMPKYGEEIMQVTIKDLPARRLAVVEHYGDPKKVGESTEKLISWAKSQPINLKPQPGGAFGFGYNDPNQVPANEFRFDLGLTVPYDFKLSGEVIEKELPAGRYAVVMHKGSHNNIGDTIYSLYRDWLPKSNEELGDLPCIFCYYNFDYEVAETELLTEIWLLLK